MLEQLLHRFERLLTGDAAEYIIAAAAIVVWWVVSKTVHTVRRARGVGQDPTGPEPTDSAEPRPRRRIPLY